jgi:hypothetical protein
VLLFLHDGDEALLAALCSGRLDPVARREEGAEALDERWMASEERCDAVDDARRVDAEQGEE